MLLQSSPPHIDVRDLTLAYGDSVIQRGLSFHIQRGEIFVVMGGSGCGKSTLMRHLIGLQRPAAGMVSYQGEDFWGADEERRQVLMRRMGVSYQSGALWTSMTLAENIALPLEEYKNLPPRVIGELASFKLSLVGLAGFENYYPAQISGGMRKRVAIARAMALDPEILFVDEPSAGLDPVSAHRLDELILQLRDGLGTTVVVVTHALASIFAIGDNSVFLDTDSRTMIASGHPLQLLKECTDVRVQAFLTRGGSMQHQVV